MSSNIIEMFQKFGRCAVVVQTSDNLTTILENIFAEFYDKNIFLIVGNKQRYGHLRVFGWDYYNMTVKSFREFSDWVDSREYITHPAEADLVIIEDVHELYTEGKKNTMTMLRRVMTDAPVLGIAASLKPLSTIHKLSLVNNFSKHIIGCKESLPVPTCDLFQPQDPASPSTVAPIEILTIPYNVREVLDHFISTINTFPHTHQILEAKRDINICKQECQRKFHETGMVMQHLSRLFSGKEGIKIVAHCSPDNMHNLTALVDDLRLFLEIAEFKVLQPNESLAQEVVPAHQVKIYVITEPVSDYTLSKSAHALFVYQNNIAELHLTKFLTKVHPTPNGSLVLYFVNCLTPVLPTDIALEEVPFYEEILTGTNESGSLYYLNSLLWLQVVLTNYRKFIRSHNIQTYTVLCANNITINGNSHQLALRYNVLEDHLLCCSDKNRNISEESLLQLKPSTTPPSLTDIITINGNRQSVQQHLADYGLGYNVFYERCKNGIDQQTAITRPFLL